MVPLAPLALMEQLLVLHAALAGQLAVLTGNCPTHEPPLQ
jgi:hypothetical protein